ncbi:hypothetical protein ACFX13_008694 [Malus domestica]
MSQVRISSSQPEPVNPERVKLRMESSEGQNRVPLARVVSDCMLRWFQDMLKEAKAGDSSMQHMWWKDEEYVTVNKSQ